MRVLVATDAAPPQVNGVVSTYRRLAAEVSRIGCELSFLAPHAYRTLALPFYRDIRLALPDAALTRRIIEDMRPDFIHVATEGPVGWMARGYCLARELPFTTSYHTRFPEYAALLAGVPSALGYAVARRFHNAGRGVMAATPSLAFELRQRGFARVLPWSRGVDTEFFRPRQARLFGADGPVFLSVGRLSREKNIEAFLSADLPGSKVVTGDGPHRANLQARYPDAIFTGAAHGERLAEIYASADVFVFPSRTDTFGLVMLEAMASGLPVAAYPVTGPRDVVEHGVSGFLDDDIALAARRCLELDGRSARAHAGRFSWGRAAEQFLANIETAKAVADSAAGTHARRALLPRQRIGATTFLRRVNWLK